MITSTVCSPLLYIISDVFIEGFFTKEDEDRYPIPEELYSSLPEPFLRLIPRAMRIIRAVESTTETIASTKREKEIKGVKEVIGGASPPDNYDDDDASNNTSKRSDDISIGIHATDNGLQDIIMKTKPSIDISTNYPYNMYLKSLPRWKWLNADTLPVRKSILSDAEGDLYEMTDNDDVDDDDDVDYDVVVIVLDHDDDDDVVVIVYDYDCDYDDDDHYNDDNDDDNGDDCQPICPIYLLYVSHIPIYLLYVSHIPI